jgi:galactoside O-acetyltransferase
MIHDTVRILSPFLTVILQPENIQIEAYARIDAFVKLQGGEGLFIGEHVHIASFCTINAGGGTVYIGDHSGCSNGVVIAAGMPELDSRYISAADRDKYIQKRISTTWIGRFVVIFANATILPGVKIEDYAVIGAGSVVTKDVGRGEIWWGNPAKLQKVRNIEELYDPDDHVVF